MPFLAVHSFIYVMCSCPLILQDPDTIMVHYLEVEGEAMPAESLTANVDFVSSVGRE